MPSNEEPWGLGMVIPAEGSTGQTTSSNDWPAISEHIRTKGGGQMPSNEERDKSWNRAADLIFPGSVENAPAASPSGRVFLALAGRIQDAIESVYGDIGATTDAGVLASNAARFLEEPVRALAARDAEVQQLREERDAALRTMNEHKCDEQAERAYKRAVAAEAERDRYAAAIEQLISDLDTSRANGTIYTYGQVQARLRSVASGSALAERDAEAWQRLREGVESYPPDNYRLREYVLASIDRAEQIRKEGQ